MLKRKFRNKLAWKSRLKPYLIVLLIGIIIFAFQGQIRDFIGGRLDSDDNKECPSEVIGNTDAARIIYVESPYCPACWKEELLAFPPLFRNHADSFYMEKYDIRYCSDIVEKYKVIGTPTFVFSKNDTEFVHFGYLSYNKLRKTIIELK